METFPNDDTGAAIRQWAAEGSDITKPMKIDFFVAVPNRVVGDLFASDPELSVFSQVSVEEDAETGRWTCYCSKVVVPISRTLSKRSSCLLGLRSGTARNLMVSDPLAMGEQVGIIYVIASRSCTR